MRNGPWVWSKLGMPGPAARISASEVGTDDDPATTTTTTKKMGSDERHFNVPLIVRDKVTRQCPQTTTFLKRQKSRTEVLLGTSLTPYRWAKPAHMIERGAVQKEPNGQST